MPAAALGEERAQVDDIRAGVGAGSEDPFGPREIRVRRDPLITTEMDRAEQESDPGDDERRVSVDERLRPHERPKRVIRSVVDEVAPPDRHQ